MRSLYNFLIRNTTLQLWKIWTQITHGNNWITFTPGKCRWKTLLLAVSELEIAQEKITKANQVAARKVLDYCAVYPNPKIIYHGRQIHLKVHSDAVYLSAPKARGHVGGICFWETNHIQKIAAWVTGYSFQLQESSSILCHHQQR